MTKPFRQRNPVPIGAVSIALIVAMMMVAFNADKLPLIGGGDTYYANFSETGGLKANDEVRIAGVRVGKVKGLELMGDHVRVEFQVKTDSEFGTETGAEIRVKTILGAMFVMLTPDGSGQLTKESEIPVSRTSSPYDIVEAFAGLASTSEAINTDRLTTSLNTLTALTKNTPDEFRLALRGVSALSQNVAARDEQLNTLLVNLRTVSGTVADQGDNLITLMEDGDQLFRALVRRRDSVHRLLVATSVLSKELSTFVRQTRADLKPALDNLDSVVQNLLDNQDNLDRTLSLMAPFYQVFGNTLGNGPWFDTIIQNLPPIPSLSGSLPTGVPNIGGQG